MRRRDFITLVSAAAAALPLNTWAQTPAAPVIGFFSGGSPYEWAPFVAAFRKGLSEMGYLEGRNASIEFRWTFGDRQQVPVLARDLVTRQVDVIVTSGGIRPTQASLEATSTIPIVAVFGDDPVEQKLIASLDHPGCNLTVVSLVSRDLEIKRLQLLREIVPKATNIGLITDPTLDPALVERREFEDAVKQLGMQGIVIPATTEADIEDAFSKLVQRRVDAFIVTSTAYFLNRRDRFAALAARYKIPAIYPARPFVDAGGLVSYGVDRTETYRQVGLYTGRIMRGGGTPADMPVIQATKFELVVNAKTAKALGVTVPQSLLTLADAVIQ